MTIKRTANRKDNIQISFRVSEQDYKKILQNANLFGKSVPSFCKFKAQSLKVITPRIDREGAMQMAFELRKVGVNVNQIAKHFNSGGNTSNQYLEELQGIRKELNSIWQLLNSALPKQ